MSQHLANSGFYDEGLIDNRNERPLTIAFATIMTVWMLAFGLVSIVGSNQRAVARSDRRLLGSHLDNGQEERAGGLCQADAVLATPGFRV